MKKLLLALIVLSFTGWFGSQLYFRLQQERSEEPRERDRAAKVVPVEVQAATRGTIRKIRTFTGTLEASQEFVVASNVSGRIKNIAVKLSGRVDRGQVVVQLDNAEYQQALTQAEADLTVARANLAEANSLLEIAGRELARLETLNQRGVSTESERDKAKAIQLARSAALQVAKAQVTRVQAAVETARIRLGYSSVTANWSGDSQQRVVAERFVNPGQMVAANEPLIRIVDLSEVIAVFFVTERDYALLTVAQPVQVSTDAYFEEQFAGQIENIAPVFQQSTRQARVEVRVNNADYRLKPGMFTRIEVVLDQQTDALIIPERALITRQNQVGVFEVTEQGNTVIWRPVQTGIQQNDSVQLLNSDISGDVVVLGQQLLDDGSGVLVISRQAQ